MRRTLSAIAATGLAITLLSACTPPTPPPPTNDEAVAAAAEYSANLSDWAVEVSDTTVQRAETDTDRLDEVLDAAPTLTDVSDTESTPAYIAAERVSAHVDRIIAELRGYASYELEPVSEQLEAKSQLAQRLDAAYTDRSDLIGLTVTRPSAETISQRLAAHQSYAESVVTAYEEEAKLVESIVPDGPDVLAGSLRSFVLDRLDQSIAFHRIAAQNAASWSQFGNGYKNFYEKDLDSSWTILAAYFSVDIAVGYGEQLNDVSGLLAETIDGDTVYEDMVLPAIGEPYRTALLDGIPPASAPASERDTMWRLWMLWRIRELEKTPDAEYDSALAAISEEFVVRVDSDVPVASLHYPGSQRLIDALALFTFVLTSSELDDDWLTRLAEVREYEDALRADPTVVVITDAFDDLLASQDELIVEITELVNAQGAEAASRVRELIAEHVDEGQDVVLSALHTLDAADSYEQMLTDAIKATAPAASNGT